MSDASSGFFGFRPARARGGYFSGTLNTSGRFRISPSNNDDGTNKRDILFPGDPVKITAGYVAAYGGTNETARPDGIFLGWEYSPASSETSVTDVGVRSFYQPSVHRDVIFVQEGTNWVPRNPNAATDPNDPGAWAIVAEVADGLMFHVRVDTATGTSAAALDNGDIGSSSLVMLRGQDDGTNNAIFKTSMRTGTSSARISQATAVAATDGVSRATLDNHLVVRDVINEPGNTLTGDNPLVLVEFVA